MRLARAFLTLLDECERLTHERDQYDTAVQECGLWVEKTHIRLTAATAREAALREALVRCCELDVGRPIALVPEEREFMDGMRAGQDEARAYVRQIAEAALAAPPPVQPGVTAYLKRRILDRIAEAAEAIAAHKSNPTTYWFGVFAAELRKERGTVSEQDNPT